MEQIDQSTLADSICNLRTRRIKRTFFSQLNTLIDWSPVEQLIKDHYKKGKSAVGKPSYNGLLARVSESAYSHNLAFSKSSLLKV